MTGTSSTDSQFFQAARAATYHPFPTNSEHASFVAELKVMSTVGAIEKLYRDTHRALVIEDQTGIHGLAHDVVLHRD